MNIVTVSFFRAMIEIALEGKQILRRRLPIGPKAFRESCPRHHWLRSRRVEPKRRD